MSDPAKKLIGDGGLSTAITHVPTRQLMALLKSARASGYAYVWGAGFHGEMVDLEDIRQELRHREHIPNKIEAREDRRRRQNGGVQHQKKAARMRFSRNDKKLSPESVTV